MSDRLSIELVLGTLLVTTLTSVGLLGLWAAVSRWNWFLRAAIVLAVLSPLLLIQAYDPVRLLLTQAAVVAIGVAAYRWWCGRRCASGATPQESGTPSRRRFRFSLTTILLATALVAVALWFVLWIPREYWFGWPDYLLTGATFGVVVLLSAWLVHGQASWILRLGVTVVVAVILSQLLSLVDDWPEYIVGNFYLYHLGDWPYPSISVWITIWFAIVPSVVLLSAINLLLLRAAGSASLSGCRTPAPPSRNRVVRYLVAVASALLLTATSIPPILLCWELLHPLPIPTVELPDPNGYDDLVAAGKMFDSLSVTWPWRQAIVGRASAGRWWAHAWMR